MLVIWGEPPVGQLSLRVRTQRRVLALAASTSLVILGSGAAVLATAGPANAVNDGKQAICHATDSNTNPYVHNEPAKSGDLNGHADHTGPLWGPDLKSHHISWGDIIPPFDYPDGQGGTAHFPGLNWPAGKATFENGCDFVPPALHLTVVKTNDADGDQTFSDEETAATAGASVTFHVTVTNDGDAPVAIDSIVDAVGGTPIDFACDLGTDSLAVGDSADCDVTLDAYSPAASGSKTNEVTVTGHQDGDCVLGNQAELVRSTAVDAPSCALQEDPDNTVTATDTSVVDTAAEPEPSVTPTGTVSPTAAATESASPEPTTTEGTGGGGTVETPSPTPSPTETFTGGGGKVTLPFTGLPVALLVSTALGMLALGAWLTFVARKQRA